MSDDDDDTLSALSDDAETARAAAPPVPRARRASELRFEALGRKASVTADKLETRNQAARDALQRKSQGMQNAQSIVSRTIQRRASHVLASPSETVATPLSRRLSMPGTVDASRSGATGPGSEAQLSARTALLAFSKIQNMRQRARESEKARRQANCGTLFQFISMIDGDKQPTHRWDYELEEFVSDMSGIGLAHRPKPASPKSSPPKRLPPRSSPRAAVAKPSPPATRPTPNRRRAASLTWMRAIKSAAVERRLSHMSAGGDETSAAAEEMTAGTTEEEATVATLDVAADGAASGGEARDVLEDEPRSPSPLSALSPVAAPLAGAPAWQRFFEDAEAVEWPESPNRPGSAMNIISAAHRDTRAKLPRTAALKPLGLGPAGDELKPQEQVLGPAPCRSPVLLHSKIPAQRPLTVAAAATRRMGKGARRDELTGPDAFATLAPLVSPADDTDTRKNATARPVTTTDVTASSVEPAHVTRDFVITMMGLGCVPEVRQRG